MAANKKLQRTAYSYIRFSSAQQEKGDSLRRQTDLRDQVLAEHPEWTLAETTYQDLGKSAYDGSNIADGALGAFIVACESGKIPRGSVLIIEQWDRLSRLPVVEAIELFSRITRCCVDICTAIDKEIHNRESMKDAGNLLKSIIRMQLANEESEKKSKRVREALEKKRRDVKSVMTTNCPGWLRWNGSAFEAIPERAKVVLEIFQKTADGKGRLSICNELNQRNEPNWGGGNVGGWWPCIISKTLRNRAVLGEFQPHRTIKTQDGTRTRTTREPAGDVRQGYYPKVIDDVLWQKVQARIAGSKKCGGPMPGAGRPGKMPVRNLFSGIIFDGYHPKFSMVLKGNKPYLTSDWLRLHPTAQKVRWNIADLENTIFEFLRELDFAALANSGPVATEDEMQLATIVTKLDGVIRRIEQLMDSLETVVEPSQRALFLKRIAERAQEKTALEKEEVRLKTSVEKKKAATVALGEARKTLCQSLDTKDSDTRLKLRAEFRRILARIDVFPQGRPAVRNDPLAPAVIDLTFHNGNYRNIIVDLGVEITLDKDGNAVLE